MLVGDDWEKHYVEQIMPAKLVVDLEYARNASVWRDVRVILGTLRALFR